MSDGDLPFALIAWIKKQREKEEAHLASMAKRNAKDDELYVKLMIELLTEAKLTIKERILTINLLNVKHEGRNLSCGQKSAVASLYYKKAK
jgi:hypothetical protein